MLHKGMILIRLPGLLILRTYSKLTQVDFQVELDIQDSLQLKETGVQIASYAIPILAVQSPITKRSFLIR
jgi:hypothetical protein